ncbi:MAG TPA: endonuclease MutS2 [Phycisphaerae bacterium]|nr:endonuclease MutS2 [Phycisphaerae bacterium]
MNEHTLERLEFGKVLERIAAQAQLGLGADAVRALRPTTDLEAIRTRAGRIAEAVQVFEKGETFGVDAFEDPAAFLERAAIQDAALAPMELRTVALILRNADDVQRTFRRLRSEAPLLWKLAFDLAPEPDLAREIEAAVEPDGTVADAASKELARLRRAMRVLQDRIRKRLERMVQDADLKPFLGDDYVTLRGGRYVLPVQAAQAGQVPGIIHDRSDTGHTVFLEPQQVVPLGNELRTLVADEEREVQRILRSLTDRVREHLEPLRRTVRTLVEFDLVRAAARYGRAHRMTTPVFAEKGAPLCIVRGRHPILEDALTELGREVVPLDFEIGGPVRTIAITGANAGGKTVALKTIGLLCLMAQTGLPVPAEKGTCFLPLAQIAVDVGDEQSIEANLSTFSAHVGHTKEILASAGEGTLVLLDEIGAGTDPTEGGALACAVLEALHARGAWTVVTTHLGQVKGFVHERDGMENAAVEFDPETLEPTYRLILGRPGASHALRIARRLGLPGEVLAAAEELVDSGAIEMEGLLTRLTESLKKAETEAASARRHRAEAESKSAELAQRLEQVKRERKEALRRAAEEARNLVENTRREMQQALEDARRAGADTEATRHLRRKVEEKRGALKRQAAELAPRLRGTIPLEQLTEGQRVWVAPMKCHGLVARVDKRRKKVTVEARDMTIEVELSAIQQPGEAGEAPPPQREGRTVVERPASVAPELHLRGERYDEARRHLETYLNEACLAELPSVRIIHGHGTGALQQMVHDFLKEFPLVVSFRFGERGEGGMGVTVATLK